MLLQVPLLSPATTSHHLCRVRFSAARSRHHHRRRRGSLEVSFSLGGGRWNLTDLDHESVREKLSSWLLKAQTLITDVATPLVKPGQPTRTAIEHELEDIAVKEEVFMTSDLTVDRNTPNGCLSFAAVVSIEQFGRMNGLTGRKMQKLFKAIAPDPVRNDARSLVEYCCFRYLSRDSSDFHPSLKVR